MDTHGNRDHSAHLLFGVQNDGLAQRLHALHTNFENTPKALDYGFDGFRIIQDDLQCNAAFAHSDARVHIPRRQTSYFSSLYPNKLILIRDTDGNVFAPAYGPVSNGCQDRQSIPVTSLALVLLWKAVRLFASCLGAYEVHVTWTFVGLFLGTNKQALSDVFFAVCAFMHAPFATLKLIYDVEMDFRGRLQEKATLIRHQLNTSTGWTRKSSLHIRLCLFAMVEIAAFHYTGGQMGFGLCCLYFAWFTILPVLGV
ncbi:hypothetical protein MBLNU13_g10432t2 [Cladosporium sp. NU13]